MANVISELSGLVGGTVGGTEKWVPREWTQRLVQVSVYSGIVFWILSSYELIAAVEKMLANVVGFKVGKDGTRVLHAVIFMLFMYVGTRFILDPLVHKMGLTEGFKATGEQEQE